MFDRPKDWMTDQLHALFYSRPMRRQRRSTCCSDSNSFGLRQSVSKTYKYIFVVYSIWRGYAKKIVKQVSKWTRRLETHFQLHRWAQFCFNWFKMYSANTIQEYNDTMYLFTQHATMNMKRPWFSYFQDIPIYLD